MSIYRGKERRYARRREQDDRRADIRWELDKDDRRHGVGRRQSDVSPASGLSRIETAEDVHWTMARLESPLPFRELTFADIR